MEERFPIMGKKYGEKRGYVPSKFMRQFNTRARANHGQTIDRLGERGGLTPQEAMAIVDDDNWGDWRYNDDDDAWAHLQLIVSDKYPNWSFT